MFQKKNIHIIEYWMNDVQIAIRILFPRENKKENGKQKSTNQLQPEYTKNKSRVSNFASKAVQILMNKFYWRRERERERTF